MPQQRGYSPNSCETYAHSFRLLFGFAAERLHTRPSLLQLEQIDADMVVAFLYHIEHDRGNGPATRNLRLAAIKSFMRYVELRHPGALEQIAQINAIPGKRHDQKLIRHLTMDEVRAVLDAPDATTRLGLRDRAMLHLCFAGGLRVSELIGLTLENVTLQPRPSILVFGKGRRERSLPLWKETARDLRAWLAVRGKPPATELFVNAQGMAMTRSGFEYILEKHAKAAAARCPTLSGRTLSPHLLRHKLCSPDAAGYPRHPQGRALAWPRRYPHHRGVPADGSVRKARGRRGGAAAGTSTRSVQGARCIDRVADDRCACRADMSPLRGGGWSIMAALPLELGGSPGVP